MKKLIILLIIFITNSSYKRVDVISTELQLEEIRQNLCLANQDLEEVELIIRDEKTLKKIQRKIRNENN